MSFNLFYFAIKIQNILNPKRQQFQFKSSETVKLQIF